MPVTVVQEQGGVPRWCVPGRCTQVVCTRVYYPALGTTLLYTSSVAHLDCPRVYTGRVVRRVILARVPPESLVFLVE